MNDIIERYCLPELRAWHKNVEVLQDIPTYMHNSLSSEAFRLMRGSSSGSAHMLKSAFI
jgi:hypothetical protein